MRDDFSSLLSKFQESLEGVSSMDDLAKLKSQYLGKKGEVSQILLSLKDLPPQQRAQVGPLANGLKETIRDSLAQRALALERATIDEKLKSSWIDVTDRDSQRAQHWGHGGFHPRTLVQKEVEEVFLSMGFEILDGPHIEDEYHNFEALNIGPHHPARDMQDTFWLDSPGTSPRLLRTHTSSVQVHAMKTRPPPFRFIAPGLVFRCERTDASHEAVFSQLEGMLVAQRVSVANLIYFLKVAVEEIFHQRDIEVRLRPGYFPFVEPGFELDIQCQICGGLGHDCRVCKETGWVELLPCGMVHPKVLSMGGIDPEKFQGFAFGLGLDRLVMMKYGLDDIRLLTGGDLRFSQQFRAF